MSPATTDLTTTLLEPIAGPSPCGALLDADVEEDLLWLQDTIEKTTAFGTGTVDWAGVLEKSVALFGRSKDWSLACYIARATYQVEGLPGLLTGLEFLRGCAERYWGAMYPSLPAGQRKRANLLDWYITSLADELTRRTAVSAAEAAIVTQAREALSALDEKLEEGLGKSYPGVRLLREALGALQDMAAAAQTPVAEEPVAQEAAPAAEPEPAAPAAGEFPPPIESPDQADVVLGRCREGIFAAAHALQAADPAAARPYRLRRLAAWMAVDAIAADPEGRIGVPGPGEGETARLRAWVERDAQGALDEVEGRLPGSPLWLDLQQIAWSALDRLGASCEAARDAVAQETGSLLRRLPELKELAFADGGPLADGETRAWIDAEALAGGGAAEGAAAAGAAPGADGARLAEAIKSAGELARAGEIEKSLAVFQEGLKGAAGGRERFLWWLAAARHCGRTGEIALALDLLDGLEREAGERALESWEPDLVNEVLQAALAVGRKGKAKKGPPLPVVTERMPHIGRRLARLDLVAALRIAKDR